MALMLQGHHLLLLSSSLIFPFQCFACSSAAVLSFCSAGKIEQKGGRYFFFLSIIPLNVYIDLSFAVPGILRFPISKIQFSFLTCIFPLF